MKPDSGQGWETAGRIVVRALLAAFTAVVVLLFQSAFWSGRVSSWMQAVLLATALLSYFRPQAGLLALAMLVPLGQVGSRTLDSQMRGAEALALAFLAGALVRGWTLREFRSFPSNRVETAALMFGLVVAASCVEQIWFLQIQRDYPWPFVQGVLAYAGHDYVATFRGYGMIFHGMLLLEGMALLLFTLEHARRSPVFARRLVMALVLGAAGTALLMLQDLVVEFAGAATGIVEFVAVRRRTAHISDVNAAGSFFAMAMFIAFGLALGDRRRLPAWIAAGVALGAAALITQSRTALAAAALVAVCVAAVATLGRFIGAGKSIGLTVLACSMAAIALWLYLPREYFGVGATAAVEIRWLFLGTTWRMLLANPLFGVGVGQYALWSFHFAAPELLKYYISENAHNNFAQIAGELGATGLAFFLALLALALRRRRDGSPTKAGFAAPVMAGLAAFILSWLGGHPLLVPEAAYPFWLALGVAAAGSLAASAARADKGLVATALVLLALSIPLRVHVKSQSIDFSDVRYGFSARQLVMSRARFFVPAGTLRVDVPLRGRSPGDEQPILVDVLVDDVPAETVSVTERRWQTASLALPADSTRRFHQIELHVRPSGTIEETVRERIAVEVGNWKITSKPNG